MSGERFRVWLGEFLEKFEPLERSLAEAWWRVHTCGGEEAEAAAGRLEEQYRRFLADPERYARLRSFAPETLDDDLLIRQRDLLANSFEQHQMDETIIEQLVATMVQVESEYNNFRASIGGKQVSDNHLREILRNTNGSREARDAWEASKQIGPRVASRVLDLVRLRNSAARSRGYDNYQLMSLELNELQPDRLFAMLERLADLTDEPHALVKEEIDRELSARFGVPAAELMPWHYGDPFFQTSPRSAEIDLDAFYDGKKLEDLTRAFYRGIGLEVDDLLDRSDLYEREGKCQHAFCTHIDRRGDIRVLCNLRSDENWMSTMLHEFGHAVYDKYIAASLPYVLREPAHISTTEAIAMLFGRLSRNANFLTEVAGAEPSAVAAVAGGAREELRRQEIVFVRWALVVVFFERELYRNPEQDLNALWWRLVERFQRLEPVDRSGAADWASKIHIATAPVYYQNYILGELTASQLERHILGSRLAGAQSLIGRTEVGQFLVDELFAAGKRYPWEELIEKATGAALDPRFFLEEFGEASSGPRPV